MSKLFHSISANSDITIEEFHKKVKEKNQEFSQFRKAIYEVLEPTVDFWTVNEVDINGEPIVRKFLSKSGALKLINLLGLQPEFHVKRHELMLPNHYNVFFDVVCLLKDANGEVVGEGAASSSARVYKSTNMALKMARKSALVDAVIYATGIEFSPDSNDGREKDDIYSVSTESMNAAQNEGISLVTPELVKEIKEKAITAEIPLKQILDHCGVSNLESLSQDVAQDIVVYLTRLIEEKSNYKARKEESQHVQTGVSTQ